MTSLNDLLPVIQRAARSVAHQWPGVVERDDIQQSIYVRLLESEGSLNKVLAMDSKAQYRAIVGIGHQIASQERTDYAHYKGSYRYSVAEVKGLLKSGALKGLELDPEVQRPTDEDGGGGGGGESKPPVKDSVLDLRKALRALESRNQSYHDAIVKRYLLDELMEGQQEKDALKRGHTALTDEMNRTHRTDFVTRDDGPGTRQVRTNLQLINSSHADLTGEEVDE
ncbi:sigma-K factor [Mycobacterium phage BabyRay]|uniref:Helix-turn-helix DNA binding domain protein n=1 Tax=Mycobacterium phage BabyRay TaxID=1897486 RepID=A0A1D8EW88_9CAUD|nr:sigma-K factor [Mycobacterium phage BabyRay]AOT25497.1 helix-turn-helix DNA binding domain protein [Mycobacterium phage BabyRay]